MDNENETTGSQEMGDSAQTAPGQVEMNPATAAAVAADAPIGGTEAAQVDDVSDHKLYAVLGYIIPFLFFLPLIQDSSKDNAFARFHANQQLLLLILLVSIGALNNVLFMILYFIWFALAPLVYLAVLVLVIMGVINASKGEMKELPILGKFRLLK